jgi:putative heme-binding domain-containing protein
MKPQPFVALAVACGHAAAVAAAATSADKVESDFQLPAGFAIRLVAAEPDLANPMTLCVDEGGAAFVSEAHTYRYGPQGSPVQPPSNPIKRIEVGSDGRAARVTVAAAGFPHPVMGLHARAGTLYATCLNELFAMDIGADGRLSNRRLLVKDAAVPWNPFGMYRVVVGPDDWLWLSIGDHPDSVPVTLTGADGRKVQLRGQSGGMVRCRRDGTGLELVVQGFRAPYAFDFDPWGHLWHISNGEGSPNLYVHVIPGLDYGYRSRPVDYPWLAGKAPLSPPVRDMGAGANTAALHYYSSQFPDEYCGAVFVANWGSHGENPANREITLWRRRADGADRTGTADHALTGGEKFLTTRDPHFRPTGLAHAPDGALYLIDWHGRDDESDLTGRLLKISRTSPAMEALPSREAIATMPAAETVKWLGHPNYFVREQAVRSLANAGDTALGALDGAAQSGEPLTAAQAVWALARMSTPSASEAMARATLNRDARVRAHALRQLRHSPLPPARQAELARPLLADPDAEVRLEAALALDSPAATGTGLLAALEIAREARLRHQIGFELARRGNVASLEMLRLSASAEHRRVAMIAADNARLEKTALAELVKDWSLDLAPPRFTAERLARLEAGGEPLGESGDKLVALASIAAVKSAPPPHRLLLELLRDAAWPVQVEALRTVRLVASGDAAHRQAVLELARSAANGLVKLEAVYTAADLAEGTTTDDWQRWLHDADVAVATAALRASRLHPRPSEMRQWLSQQLPAVATRHPSLAGEVRFIQHHAHTSVVAPASTPPDNPALAAEVLEQLPRASATLGRLVFTTPQFACTACHSDTPGESLTGPSLAGLGAAAQPAYIVESILDPSRVLKTGWALESVATSDGGSLTGRVTADEGVLTVAAFGAEPVRIALADVKSRATLPVSPMPSGLAAGLTAGELADLTAWLLSLK